MRQALIIVESPAKIKTLKKFLGKNFSFASSIGHIRDLPEREFGIDIEHNFEPKYINLPDKKEVIRKLKEAAKEADVVYLSPDPDREGEAIAWHIAAILPKETPIKRMTFYSITKTAVLEALKHPRNIDLALVNAQQARRLLDRIVGYKISPLLTRKIKKGKNGTSAGRVQSVALKLVVNREKEIDSFTPIEYWNIKAQFINTKNKKSFEAFVYSINGKKVEKEKEKNNYHISSEKDAKEVTAHLTNASFKVKKVEKKEKKRNPVPPFITSTLQQEASRHFGFAVFRTMNIAQGLYEGIDLGNEGREGLITYMRTDSVKIAHEALQEARRYISEKYGKKYLPEEPRHYSSKKTAQEAHEAIRPTNLSHPPEKIKQFLTPDQFKLYSLIWRRFIASQMVSAIYDTVSVDIAASQKNIILRTLGSVIKFQGFLAAYEEKRDMEIEEAEDHKILPPLKENDILHLQDLLPIQSFTKPPPRFTEASLVKELERSGIGRPSTYASIMNKIQRREYTIKENKTLKPTELGKIIVQMLEENFKPIMNIGFTSAMEDDLELIAENKKEWKKIIREFWNEFIPMVEKAQKEAKVPKITTEIVCPKCGAKLQKIWSRNKYFFGCSNYPDCDFTSSIEALEFKKEDYDKNFNWDQNCPRCGSSMQIRFGPFGPFLGCSKYPQCKGMVNIPKKGEKILKPQDRPSCPAQGCDGKIAARRSRFGKIFYSCTNFPECDVVVNDLSELNTKYQNHPKTKYVKKEKVSKQKGKSRQYLLSKELAAILQEKQLTRAEIMKKLWEYIKSHKLQDPQNKRIIIPNEKLSKLFPSPIDMMQLPKILKDHLK